MKKVIKYGLVLGFSVVLSACGKKAEEPVVVEPPVIEKTESAIKRTLETAKEKTSDFKESAGEALDTATDHVMSFKERAGEAIKKVKPGAAD